MWLASPCHEYWKAHPHMSGGSRDALGTVGCAGHRIASYGSETRHLSSIYDFWVEVSIDERSWSQRLDDGRATMVCVLATGSAATEGRAIISKVRCYPSMKESRTSTRRVVRRLFLTATCISGAPRMNVHGSG